MSGIQFQLNGQAVSVCGAAVRAAMAATAAPRA